MAKVDERDRRWRLWFWIPLAAGGAAGGAAAWLTSGGGSAHLNPEQGHPFPFHQDMYTFGSPDCSPSPDAWVDPINVVFIGPLATDENVKEHAARSDHGRWNNHSGGQQYFWDHSDCEPVEASGWNYHSANGGSLEDRFHMRYNMGDIQGQWDFQNSLPGGGGFYTLAAVHHEDYYVELVCNPQRPPECLPVKECHAVDTNQDEPPGGFNMGRTELTWLWLNAPDDHRNLGFYEWENTEPREQCDGLVAWSDGWVRYLGMGLPSGTPFAGGGCGRGVFMNSC